MITIKGNQPSAKVLRELVAAENIDTVQPVVIRWGLGVPETQRPEIFYLNNIVRMDGVEQFHAFDMVGLNTPEFTFVRNEAIEWVRNGIEVWGRKAFHTRGNDIVGSGWGKKPRNPNYINPKWLQREFWVQVVPDIKDEWRVHIFRGRCIAKGRKVQTDEPRRRLAVRNRQNGWTLEHQTPLPDHIREAARLAVNSLGYDFGAVDVIEQYDGTPVVLEVNSAPALGSDYTQQAYLKAIKKVASGKYRTVYGGAGIDQLKYKEYLGV